MKHTTQCLVEPVEKSNAILLQKKRIGFRPLSLMLIAVATLVALMLTHAAIGFAKESVRDQAWVATWGASPMAPLPASPPNPNARPNPGFTNQTVRMVVHTSIGGNQVRVRLSNTFGTDSLVIGSAHIALHSKDAAIAAGTDRTLAFSGAASTTIPPGALVVSDPVQLNVPDLSDLAVTIFLPGSTGPSTFHMGAQSTNFISPPGDFTGSADMPVDHTATSWFYLTDVEVAASKKTLAIITIGDSITDGARSTMDTNHRWPDLLAERLHSNHIKLAVVNQGIGGNRLLHDQTGPNILARLDRDVLTQSGAGYLTVLIGINDIGYSVRNKGAQEVSADELIAGLTQVITRAHQAGIKVLGCTLTPAEGASYANVDSELKRAAVNKFIRSGAFDAVIDFDAAVRDPAHPGRFLPANDSGDHLHPNDTGYQAMANAINLSLFKQAR